jgi:hypothetical protein
MRLSSLGLLVLCELGPLAAATTSYPRNVGALIDYLLQTFLSFQESWSLGLFSRPYSGQG